jgi:hypothetical protein
MRKRYGRILAVAGNNINTSAVGASIPRGYDTASNDTTATS